MKHNLFDNVSTEDSMYTNRKGVQSHGNCICILESMATVQLAQYPFTQDTAISFDTCNNFHEIRYNKCNKFAGALTKYNIIVYNLKIIITDSKIQYNKSYTSR